LLIFGVALLYLYVPEFVIDFNTLTQFIELNTNSVFSLYPTTINHVFIIISSIFIIVSLLCKIGAFPFSIWLPDVYETPSYFIFTILMVLMKPLIMMITIKIVISVFLQYLLYSNLFKTTLLVISILSLIIGAFGAINQKKFKKMLVYTSINHIGFMFLGLALLPNTFNNPVYAWSIVQELSTFSFNFYLTNSLASIFQYLFVYTITSLLLLLIIQSLESPLNRYVYLNNFYGLYCNNKIITILIILLLSSFAGLPPFAGFFAKWSILQAIYINNIDHFIYIGFALVSSFITSVPYFTLILILLNKSGNSYHNKFTLKTEIITSKILNLNLKFYLLLFLICSITIVIIILFAPALLIINYDNYSYSLLSELKIF